jgi:3-hydroxyacyl-CoA dehydrogenase
MDLRKPSDIPEIQESVDRYLAKQRRRELISEREYNARKSGVMISSEIKDLAGCDLVIESIIEKPEIKKNISPGSKRSPRKIVFWHRTHHPSVSGMYSVCVTTETDALDCTFSIRSKY